MIAWLIDTLVMTGGLMALVLLVRKPVGRWFGAGSAYALWALPMIRLVLPPLALPKGLIPQIHVGAEQVTASARSLPVENLTRGDTAMTVVQAGAAPFGNVAAPVTQMAEPSLLAQLPWGTVLLSVWLTGAAVFLVWRAVSYRAMRRDLLKGARQVAQSGRVRIVETPATSAPLAFGVFDKIIALPVGFLANADSQTSDFAIAHELEHHAASDLLALIALQPLFALHWFNPIAWAAWRSLRSDQEAACDARVVAGRCRNDRANYGRLIASFAGGSRLGLAAPMAGPLSGEKPIVHRLKALARKDVTPARRVLARSLFALAIVAVPATATVTYADSAGEPAEPTEPLQAASPAEPAAPAVPAEPEEPENVAQEQDIPDAPQAPEAPEPPTAPRAVGAAPVPPTPPVPPASAAASATRASYQRAAANAARLSADADRLAALAIARAPKVRQTVSADGQRRTISITRTNGSVPATQTMVLDESCPADTQRRAVQATHGGTHASVVICTGEPKNTQEIALRAIRTARASIMADNSLDAEVKADILRDLDEEITATLREAHDS